MQPSFPRSLLCTAALAPALAGCGTTKLDEAKTEQFVRDFFTPPARTADCPGGVEAKKGKTFTCTAVDARGRRFRVTARVLDSEGRITIGTGDVKPLP